MAKNFYGATALIGGGAGALDAIDGAALADLDGAIVITASARYVYTLDVDSGAAESSPEIIAPDANAGDKRWILTGISQVGTTPISTAQWGYLGAMDHGVAIGQIPAFLVHPTVDQTNITKEIWTDVVWGTEVFDIGGNFAANIFTAPVTGKYRFEIIVRLLAVDIDATELYIRLATTARSYSILLDPRMLAADGTWTVSLAITADMVATNTAKVEYYQQGGANQTDIDTLSFFSGSLVA